MSSAGGGGSSAGYPEYIMEIHNSLIRGKVLEVDMWNQYPFVSHTGFMQYLDDALDGDSPYASIANPYIPITEITDRDTLNKDILSSFQDNIQNADGTLNDSAIKEAWTNILIRVKNNFDSYLKKELTNVDGSSLSNPGNQISSIMTDASNMADDLIQKAGYRSKTDITDKSNFLANNTINQADNIVTNAINRTYSNMLDMTSLANSDRETVIASIVSSVRSQAENLINDAITNAVTAIGQAVVTNAVDAYEANSDGRALRNIGRFASGMADIGAANSSAYIQGNAFMESEIVKDVNKFEADLKIEIFKTVLQLQMTNQTQLMSIEAQVYRDNLNGRIQHFLGTFDQFVKTYLTHFTETMKQYLSTFATYADVDKSAYLTQLTKFFDLHQVKLNYDKAFINQNVKDIVALRADLLSKQGQAVGMTAEINRITYTALKEYYDKRMDITRLDQEWDLSLWQHAANLLAAPAGGVVTTDKPSQASSVLGGVFSGAAVGAQVGGGVPGAVAGGVIGGVLGLIS